MNNCIECKKSTKESLSVKKEKCNLCNWFVCKSCSTEVRSGVLICSNYCLKFYKMSKMSLEELRQLPIKTLKEYTKAYGISISTIFEKEELAKLVSSSTITEDQRIVFHMNHSSAAKSNLKSPLDSGRTSTNSTPQESSSQSAGPSVEKPDPIANFFQNVGNGFQEMSSAFQGVGNVLKEALSPKMRERTENAPPSIPTTPVRETPPPAPTSITTPHSTQQLSSDIDPPSLTTIATTGLALNTLSTKALKRILLRERVSTIDVNDREELLRRCKVLVDNVGKELAESEDNMCKVCCERPINCVLLECGHLCVCIECGEQISKSTHECPICRSRITRIIHTFKAVAQGSGEQFLSKQKLEEMGFFKKKVYRTTNNNTNNNSLNNSSLNTDKNPEGSDEKQLELLSSKFAKLPYLKPCDTVSAHEKHTLPQAKQLFAWLDTGEEATNHIAVREPTKKSDEKIITGQLMQESSTATLNTATASIETTALAKSQENSSTSLVSSTSQVIHDREMLISPASPDAIFVSVIPKEIVEPLPLRKTVSFQENVTTYSHEEFQARLDELRRRKWEERGSGLFGRISYFLKRIFACGRQN